MKFERNKILADCQFIFAFDSSECVIHLNDLIHSAQFDLVNFFCKEGLQK